MWGATYRTLWEYQIRENERTDSGVRIQGQHVQVNDISDSLLAHMKMYGITEEEIREIKK